jgi:hypothetical protein
VLVAELPFDPQPQWGAVGICCVVKMRA